MLPRPWPPLHEAALRDWLAAGLQSANPGLPPDVLLEALAGELWRDARACWAVIHQLAHTGLLAELLRLPALFVDARALDHADIVRLHAMLRAQVGDTAAARLLIRR